MSVPVLSIHLPPFDGSLLEVLPEMRTALRTYHPVPSLQKADANLQDAPRIKNILKACSLKDEAATNMPVTPAELRARAVSARSTHLRPFLYAPRQLASSRPPVSSIFSSSSPITSPFALVPCLFSSRLLTQLSQTVAHDHFGSRDIDFLDLFLPVRISSPSRARAFLWLAFHYHEAPSVNPFDDQHARKHLGLIPELTPLTEEEFEKENVDPEDERNYAEKMTKLRIEFLAKNAQGGENNSGNHPKDRKGTAKSKARPPSPGKSIPAKRERSDPDSAVEDEADLGTFHFLFTQVLLIFAPGPPSRKRRPKQFNPSRALSESSITRMSNRHSSSSHRSILQRMIIRCSHSASFDV